MIELDFETFSEAGYAPKEGGGWQRLAGAQKYGISAVGAAVYAQHPSTEILSLAYSIDRETEELWVPGMPMPHRLFDALHTEDEIEAWNVSFECWIWRYVAVSKLKWPWLPLHKLRCAMARSRAYSLPGALAKAGEVLRLPIQKDKAGEALLSFFSAPRQPTKANGLLRNYPSQYPQKAQELYSYNKQDVRAERAAVDCTPRLIDSELAWWQVEQACNRRGVHVDMPLVRGALAIQQRIQSNACEELSDLTEGAVRAPTEIAKLSAWLRHSRGIHTDSLDEDAVDRLLGLEGLDAITKRVLQVRSEAGSASVRKYASIERQVAMGDRLHDLFNYHGAHTGRETAADVQPQNLPNAGPDVAACTACRRHYGALKPICPWCGSANAGHVVEWSAAAATDAILVVSEGSLDVCLRYFDAATPILSSCLRGVFKATPGYIMMGSDFSAIEGVGAAMLTGEVWRIDVFRTHGKIYEMGASKAFSVSLEDMLEYARVNGRHHPLRKKGKIGELAGGYGGGKGAWINFGAEGTEDEIQEMVNAWRAASPQFPLTWYAMHGAFVEAMQTPNTPIFPAKKDRSGTIQGYIPDVSMTYFPLHDVLRLRLPSGRCMTYHRPRLETEEYGRPGLSFEGWNTNPKMGPIGWVRKRTFGGRLFENLVQAACRDLLTHAAVNAYHAGYELCLHVHDELCVEVLEDEADVLNVPVLESIMMDMPGWAREWPVRAAGGWSGPRYQK